MLNFLAPATWVRVQSPGSPARTPQGLGSKSPNGSPAGPDFPYHPVGPGDRPGIVEEGRDWGRQQYQRTGGCCSTIAKYIRCFFGCLCVLAVLAILAILGLSYKLADELTQLSPSVDEGCAANVTPDNAIAFNGLPGCTPGNKTDVDFDICGSTCFNHELIRHIESFYVENTWKLVSFKSRVVKTGQETVDLKAWYIPPSEKAKGIGLAPRVVVQHGTHQNANDFEAQVAAFMLASAGFGVIVPSLRDHCLSKSSGHKSMSWGWDYPLDTLGAWDFARDDPTGEMGGPLPADQVGILGFSMGGYLAMSAFGTDQRIPAVWADAPVYSVHDMLEHSLPFPWLSPVVTPIAWYFAGLKAGQLSYFNPKESLPSGDDKGRKVMIHYNPRDTTIPESQPKKYVDLLKQYPVKYPKVESSPWVKNVTCNKETHRVTMLKHPSLYREALCTFFGDAFGQDLARCTNGTLPAILPPRVVFN